MASSTHKHQPHQLPNMYGATAAPPPTPSAQPNIPLTTTDAADALSILLHRLPSPTLTLPTRRSPPATCPPTLSLNNNSTTAPTLLEDLLSASSQLGFFQLTDHSLPSQLARSAESESLALFDLPRDKKESSFPKNWPFGYEADDEDDGEEHGESFRLDSTCSTESAELTSLDSLREFTIAMEKLGVRIVELICSAVGFENPIREDPTRFCSLMWITEGVSGNKPVLSGGFYPYIVGLQYQIRCQKYSLLADSGWVSVSPQVDSVMVTLGDIAHVWSNGKLKKVRGKPVAHLGDTNTRCISMSLLVTLPTDSTISPLLPKLVGSNDDEIEKDEEQSGGSSGEREERLFNSFSFEDYAWRVYHERILFKDPLDRYRI